MKASRTLTKTSMTLTASMTALQAGGLPDSLSVVISTVIIMGASINFDYAFTGTCAEFVSTTGVTISAASCTSSPCVHPRQKMEPCTSYAPLAAPPLPTYRCNDVPGRQP